MNKSQFRELIKVLVIFTICTSVFYVALRVVHAQHERSHRYDPPSGAAVKVMNPLDQEWSERLSIFFQLGE
ncbi:YqzK family protein [Halobacillus sp. A1]|uniref:DUF4227 family protein n=1 Tax=Halobacillus campisalis TaxID=435909 RepID=A0ABW2K3P6_9BACI|nr:MULTISPECIES: DUF4227 family protein [Halobacillus]MCP3032649.1 YqzK family protein [Halobacillus sp. A1]